MVLATALAVWFKRRREEGSGMGFDMGPVRLHQQRRRPFRIRASNTNDALRNIPIPWGWPNCTYYRGRSERTMSEALHNFADVLFREKQLVTEAESDPRIINSIRAVTEDRFHPVDRSQGVSADVQPDWDVDIWFIGPVAESRAAADRKYRSNLLEVRELRAPWGW